MFGLIRRCGSIIYGRYTIVHMHQSENSFTPKSTWDTSRLGKGANNLNNMSIFPFNNFFILRSVNTRGLVHGTIRVK